MKKLAVFAFSLYYVVLMLAAATFIADEFNNTSNEQQQHFVDNYHHNFGARNISFFFEEEETDYELFLIKAHFPTIQKLIFLFKSDNPKHACFAFYLNKVITPFHQDIYILDEVFRI